MNGLTAEERKAVIQILNEKANDGTSQALAQIIQADYDEIPVSIDEFITNPHYAGNYMHEVYPFWRKQLRMLFDEGKHYSEVAFTGSIGTGKALSLDSGILTPSGFVKMRDISVGDKVIGEDGLPHKVTHIWPQGVMPIYRITFADHTYVDCTEQHVWTVRDGNYPKYERKTPPYKEDRWINRDLSWIMSKPLRINEGKVDAKGHSRSQRRFSIPVTQPVNFEPRGKLLLHPYLLGQLIADGCLSSGSSSITVSDEDVADKLKELAATAGCKMVVNHSDEGCTEYSFIADGSENLVRKYSKELGIQVTAPYKHIPECYLYASIEDRIQLLQGLFDGDGSIQDKRYTYATVSEQLYKDITFLVESLGGQVYLTHGKDCWYTVDGTRHYTGQKVWEFQFKLPDAIKPFTSKKHELRYDGGTKFDTTHIYRYIESIEYLEDAECQCITVDNPTGLYLTDNFIVTHNSSIAIAAMGYELYKLMCLKNPQQYYGTNKTMFFAFFNNNLNLAQSVGFAAFQDLLRKSEWFNERGEWRGTVNQQYHPIGKNIELMYGSLVSHVIGKDVFCAMQDEISFAQGANIHMEQSKIMHVYNNIMERITSRFTRDGVNWGTMFLVSSKKSEYDFLESYIRKQKGKPHVFVADAKIWDVKPSDMYSGVKFNLAVGGSNLPSKIIPDDEDPSSYERQGYEVIQVPIEHKQSFELDMQSAIMNVAGISISHVLKFFTIDQIQKCYTEDFNPFVEEIIPIGVNDDVLLQDFFMAELVPEEIYSRPIFIHLDMAVTGDNAGIGAVASMGFTNVSEYNLEEGKVVSTKKMAYRHVFNVEITAPKNDQIHFAKVREFIFYLKNSLGWNIKGVSADGFNSVDMRQQLTTMGFSTSLVSLDRTPDGYMALKSAIAERRISLLKLENLERELVQLERDNTTGKLDHPLTGCFTGDTKVKLVDGRELTMLELVDEYKLGKVNYVYTINEKTLHIEPKRIKKAFFTKYVKNLVKVSLDNGEFFMCTPDHRIMLRDGEYETAETLKHGQSIMPIYTKISNKGLPGYRLYYDPGDNCWHYEHRQFIDEYVPKGYVVHHKDFNKLNNCPNNLQKMTTSGHTIYHNRNQSLEERKKRSNTVKQWHLDNRYSSKYNRRSQNISNAVTISNGKPALLRRMYKALKRRLLELFIQQECGKLIYECSPNELNSYSVRLSRILDPTIQHRISSRVRANHNSGKYNNAYKALAECNELRKGKPRSDEFKKKLMAVMATDEYKQNQRAYVDSLTAEQRSEIYGTAKGKRWYNNGETEQLYIPGTEPSDYVLGRINHTITSVEYLSVESTPVYDLSIEDNHNFALASGVFVHNSKDGSDGLAGALYNALLHENDVKNDVSDLTDLIIDVNAKPSSTVVMEERRPTAEEIQMTTEEVLAEARRRASLNYQRTRPQEIEYFNASEGILDI